VNSSYLNGSYVTHWPHALAVPIGLRVNDQHVAGSLILEQRNAINKLAAHHAVNEGNPGGIGVPGTMENL